MKANVKHWPGIGFPTEADIRRVLDAEGLSAYKWSNGPGDVYGAHSHTYHKVIYVVQGSITFGLPDTSEKVSLSQGDRLELSAGVTHDAVVGPQGVVCLEAHS
ncbi:MAG TPA: cupin domain-containing protein [Chloroflexia bacterium]|nr:cupin domain-containing protein [Chloroflexia bacterium]